MEPYAHKITIAELKKVVNLGYELQGAEPKQALTFIGTYFKNLDLLRLIHVLETTISKATNHPVFRSIQIDLEQKTIIVETFNHADGSDSFVFTRKFEHTQKGINIYHQQLILPEQTRGKGILKPLFRESLQQYMNVGASSILLEAGSINGGYVWAKYGFMAIHKNQVEVILVKAKKLLKTDRFEKVQRIFDVYYTQHPEGDEFPIARWASIDDMKAVLAGSFWKGKINLKDKKQLQKIINYVS